MKLSHAFSLSTQSSSTFYLFYIELLHKRFEERVSCLTKKEKLKIFVFVTWKVYLGLICNLPGARHRILQARLGPLLAQLFCAQQEWMSWTFTVLFSPFFDPNLLTSSFPFIFLSPKISSWKEKSKLSKS